jgi:hypothetical protein
MVAIDRQRFNSHVRNIVRGVRSATFVWVHVGSSFEFLPHPSPLPFETLRRARVSPFRDTIVSRRTALSSALLHLKGPVIDMFWLPFPASSIPFPLIRFLPTMLRLTHHPCDLHRDFSLSDVVFILNPVSLPHMHSHHQRLPLTL